MLIIFIKNPRPGHVKTRLAYTMGDDSALRIYRYLLRKTRELTMAIDVKRLLFYSEAVDLEDEWPADWFDKRLQSGAELGHRMLSAFQTAFGEGAERAVIIGSDCPDLTAALLERAFAALDAADVVIGPSADGGYYLLGMRNVQPELFQNVAWSTDKVLQQTLEKTQALGLQTTLLPELRDIDEETDWLDYHSRHPEEDF